MDQHNLPSDRLQERGIIVGLQLNRAQEELVNDSLNELEELSRTGDVIVLERMVVRRTAPKAATYIGKGKVEELAERVKELKATIVLFDDDLTPAQGRNLEKELGIRVIDRTQMILDIFAKHAKTREGRLQIELAQLDYLLPRLRRMWTHLERQKGGIGLRGPGEMQLEVDRRRIQQRIARIKSDLDRVRSHRSEQRRGRKRHGWALISLVGYTNAGKSTLFNTITDAGVVAYDQLFATLDPTTRQLNLPNNQQALLSDTVGFIKKLPHDLVAAFKATLEEVIESDLLLHVIDASAAQVDLQIKAVQQVLEELGVSEKPVIYVFNKMDLENAPNQYRLYASQWKDVVALSAKTHKGVEDLLSHIADVLRTRNTILNLRMPASEGKLLALLRECGKLLSEEYEENDVLIRASVPESLAHRWADYRMDDKKR